MSVPFVNFKPVHHEIKDEITNVFQEVYNSNWFILENKVTEFENKFSKYIGTGNGLDYYI